MWQWSTGLRKVAAAVALALAPALLGVRCDGILQGPILGPGDMEEAAFHARQLAYLRYATQVSSPGSVTNVINHLERRLVDPPYAPPFVVPADAYDARFAKLSRLEDTSDFDMLYLLNLWLGYRDDPALAPGLVAKIEDAILSFKYWYTEPTPDGLIQDDMYYWSENHQIIFHTLEYLAGQSFPDRVFTNDGRTGSEKQAHARALILDWIDLRARFGFNEWHSDVYYQKNVTPLLTLVEYAEDEEIRTRAAMALDLVLFDIASHSFRGNYGVTHGRSYKKDKTKSVDQDTYGLSKLLFDDSPEDWNGDGEPGATLLSRAKRYRPPEAIRRIATSRETSVDQQRMNLFVNELEPMKEEPVAPAGFSYSDPALLPLWWGMGALTPWQLIPLTLESLDGYNLWHTTNFKPFAPFQDIVSGNPPLAQAFAFGLRRTANLGLLREVHTYTQRTADYMLSTAQDYRAGSRGAQYHSWQATLGPRAIVFTTHPGLPPAQSDSWGDDNEPGPGYWTGEASMPRSAQHENVAIHLYAPQYVEDGGFLRDLSRQQLLTHAFFPQDRFDEVVQEGHWVFGRSGDGYVALYSWRDAAFLDYTGKDWATDGMTLPFDLVAAGGPDNVWIVECGRQMDWGSFEAFRAAVAGSAVTVTPLGNHAANVVSKGFSVRYTSPSQGLMTFGWAEPLTVGGAPVAIDGPLRFDNPWAQQGFDTRRTLVLDEPSLATGFGVFLDFEKGIRTTFGPPVSQP
jgi:hypothetical protein